MKKVVLFVCLFPLLLFAVLPEPSVERLPRWRGFNLPDLYEYKVPAPRCNEEDFQLIHEFGFNFVRLPLDYRQWIVDGDWTRIDEKGFAAIDEALEFAKKYEIHLCLNFHRAPGYSVNHNTEEPGDLWTDPAVQQIAATHWGAVARHFKGVPNRQLSFNLVNEPPQLEPAQYYHVVKQMVEAIRAEDPDRLIIADGMNYGRIPVPELRQLDIAQATRGYDPFVLTHYQALWCDGAEEFPLPTWPKNVVSGYLSPNNSPALTFIIGNCPGKKTLRFRVAVVSRAMTLTLKADGITLWSHRFLPGADSGEWKKVVYRPEWDIYQNVYDMDFQVVLPDNASHISLEAADGNWMTLSEIGLTAAKGSEAVLTLDTLWGVPTVPFRFDGTWTGGTVMDRESLWRENVLPFVELQKSGIGVLVGEFGAFNQTPHDVMLRWMEDCLRNWEKADFAWALWTFRGGFGIFDSNRPDVEYEDFRGRSLDRKLLEILQKYR